MNYLRNLLSDIGGALMALQRPGEVSHELISSGHVTLRDGDNLPELIAQIAESQVGVREGKVNNTGPEVVEYQRASWLKPGPWKWCAAFVDWCLLQAIVIHGGVKWARPQTAGAYDLENWAKGKYDARVAGYWRVIAAKSTPPRRGDICTFSWSHVGIVVRYDGNIVTTVEGNTGAQKTGTSDNPSGDGVFVKTHRLSELRNLIRLR
jgi:hypothetical protein